MRVESAKGLGDYLELHIVRAWGPEGRGLKEGVWHCVEVGPEETCWEIFEGGAYSELFILEGGAYVNYHILEGGAYCD